MADPAEPDASPPPPRVRLRVESPSIAVVRRRREAWARRILVVGGWIVGQAMLSTWTPQSAGCWGTLLGFSAVALLLSSFRDDSAIGVSRSGRKGVVTVDDDTLVVETGGRAQEIALEHVVAGWTAGFAGGDERVVLETRTGTLLSIEVGSAERAHELLLALGLAPEQRAVAMRVGTPATSGARFVFALLGLAALAVAVPSAIISAFLLWAAVAGDRFLAAGLLVSGVVSLVFGTGAALLLSQLVTTTVRIGTDGVSLQRFGRRRFIPRADLEGVGVNDGTLVFERRNGKRIAVRTSGPEEAGTLVRRVEEALAAHAGQAPAEALAALDRSGRPVDEWRRAVTALLGGGTGYRRAGIEADALLGVVEDGAARPERRVAAAVALASRRDPEARERVRVAAEACVSPKLRIAIAQAAEGEIDEDALAAAEEEAAMSGRRA
jgi:hypothetical protein